MRTFNDSIVRLLLEISIDMTEERGRTYESVFIAWSVILLFYSLIVFNEEAN